MLAHIAVPPHFLATKSSASQTDPRLPSTQCFPCCGQRCAVLTHCAVLSTGILIISVAAILRACPEKAVPQSGIGRPTAANPKP